MIGFVLLATLQSVSGVSISGVEVPSADAVLHAGIVDSMILYFDSEADADPHVNRGTKGSPTGCDADKIGTTPPAQNTSSPLQGLADYDFINGVADGHFEIDTTSCEEVRFGGDFCLGAIVNRDAENNNDRLMLNFDGANQIGWACHLRGQFSCEQTGAGEVPYCFRCYIDEQTNSSTSVAIRIGETHFLGASYSDTTGDVTMVVDGEDVTVDIGSASTPRATGEPGNSYHWGSSSSFDGHGDGLYQTDVACALTDFCFICSCGVDNEEGCTYTGGSWTYTGRNASCGSCVMPSTPSTYAGPS